MPDEAFATGVRAATRVEIVLTVEAGDWPAQERLTALTHDAIRAALAEAGAPGDGATEVGVVFTDDRRIRSLNIEWRGKDKPTNVLSFPLSAPGQEALPPLLGDIVLAFETALREAEEEEKPFDDHLSHLLVHGFLHLLGYDHETDADAEEMEELERRVLGRLAIPDPYS